MRHGPGRGRLPRYGEHLLEWVRAQRPDLAHRVRVHETGTGEASLDDVCAVFFWLGDPLEVNYPDCFREALAIEEEADRRPVKVLNRPTALAVYGKDVQASRFAAASIPAPPAMCIEGPADLTGCGDQLGFPLLVRGSRSFGHEGTRIVRNRREARSLPAGDLPDGAIVTPLLDVRREPAGSRRADLWGRYYHRKRALLIGDQCTAYSLYFGKSPVVGQDTSLYGEYHAWQKRLRPYGRLGKRALRLAHARLGIGQAVELETEFCTAPVEHADVFRRAGAALRLEFLAFDYASLPDGGIVIWEANPYPYIPSLSGNMLSHTRQRAGPMQRTCEAFALCFASLMDGCATTPGRANSPHRE